MAEAPSSSTEGTSPTGDSSSTEISSVLDELDKILKNSTVMGMEPISDDNTIGDLQGASNTLLHELQQIQGFLKKMSPMIESLQEMQEKLQKLLPMIEEVETLKTEMQDKISATKGGTIFSDLKIQGTLHLQNPIVEE